MPFESMGTVTYSPSIVTIAVSVAVCEIFSIKEWCDLENWLRVRSSAYRFAVAFCLQDHNVGQNVYKYL